MFKFGSTGILAGYIKQLLAAFHLPKPLIYTEAHAKFFEEHGYESPYLLETFSENIFSTHSDTNALAYGAQAQGMTHVPYIKDGRLQFYVGGYYTGQTTENGTEYFNFIPGRWQSAPFNLSQTQGGPWQLYERGEFIPNLSKQFQIKNNIYDSYTHEYLGDYLRFIRDFDGINLMPLYNCFSNNRLALVKAYSTKSLNGAVDITLDTSDTDYKIYSLPVKLFQNYTIAIDSAYPIELCCGLYNKGTIKDSSNNLVKHTFVKITSCSFNQPFLYTALTDIAATPVSALPTSEELLRHKQRRELLAGVANEISDLRLFIKVSKHTESSIVILEGDYCTWNDFAIKSKTSDGMGLIKEVNHTVLTNESIFSDESIDLISPLQLLKLNTGVHMPFSDRLVEYLLDQCVTGGDQEVRENVLMAQHLASLRHVGAKKTLVYRKQQIDAAGNLVVEEYRTTPTAVLKYNQKNGVWSEALRRIFYRYMSTQPDFSLTPDTLGYVDKDVEQTFAVVVEKDNKKFKKTMLSFNAWEDIDNE